MPSHLEVLGKIASYAQMVRDLEKVFTTTSAPDKTHDRLHKAREKLDEALADLAQLERNK